MLLKQIMNDMYWALQREKELGELHSHTNQFLTNLEKVLTDYTDKDPQELISKIKEIISEFKKET